MADWITDRIRTGPGLFVKNGVLDVNMADPRRVDPSLVTPVAHAYTHADGGSDEVTLAQSQISGLTDALAALTAAIAAVVASIDDLVDAAIAAIIPPFDIDDAYSVLGVASGGASLVWVPAPDLFGGFYDFADDYDTSDTYD